MSEWQPIETARKDGSKILIFVDGEIKIAYWSKTPRWWPWDGGLERPCWVGFTCGDDWFNEYWSETNPTHWMPLPDPPAA